MIAKHARMRNPCKNPMLKKNLHSRPIDAIFDDLEDSISPQTCLKRYVCRARLAGLSFFVQQRVKSATFLELHNLLRKEVERTSKRISKESRHRRSSACRRVLAGCRSERILQLLLRYTVFVFFVPSSSTRSEVQKSWRSKVMEVLKTMYVNNFSTSSSAFLFSKFRSSISHFWRSPATRPLLLLKKLKRDTICCTSAMLLEPTDTATPYTLLEFGKLDDDLNCPRTSRAARSRSTGTKGSNFTEVQTEADSLFSGMVNEALTTSHTKQQRSKSFEETESRRREMIPLHKLRQGGFVENCLVYRQVIVIRSYEVGPDMTISIDTIFRLFQEMALCHVQLLGIAGDGFGATQGMNRNGLIWVVNRMHVEVERYPAWPEVVEIDSWVGSSGKNGMRRDWVMSSYRTGEVLARATSKWCMMDATTRRLARIPEEVQSEIVPCFIQDRFAFPQPKICPKIQRIDNDSAQYLSSHLKSCRGDLDVNQHVSNLKYISWVFESVPSQQFDSHDLKSMTLEYRRECNSSDIVESLTSYGKTGQIIQHVNVENRDGNHMNDIHVNGSVNHHVITNRCPECSRDIQRPFLGIEEPCKLTHLLHTQSGHCEILRGQTTWQPRKALKV